MVAEAAEVVVVEVEAAEVVAEAEAEAEALLPPLSLLRLLHPQLLPCRCSHPYQHSCPHQCL